MDTESHETSPIDSIESEFHGIEWKGISREALEELEQKDLVEYIAFLEDALKKVNENFYRLGGDDGSPCSQDDIFFNGRWKKLGEILLKTSLRMYKLHKTQFVPVCMPEKSRFVIPL